MFHPEKYEDNPTPSNRKLWKAAKEEYDHWLDSHEMLYANHITLKFHKQGNKARRLLWRLIRGRHKPVHITKIRNSAGKKSSSLDYINKVFAEYYQTLYAEGPYDHPLAAQFLDKIKLPHLKPEQVEFRNHYITADDMLKTITWLLSGKFPGPQDYTGEFYKAFKDLLLPNLESVYSTIWQGDEYLPIVMGRTRVQVRTLHREL